jgi:crotonobetainyl-CoA:carnitine CoA-transferase CaiB-like acyl-CoA transferase
MSQPGPLSGIRVLEVCHMLAGPYCGMLLADLGAEVIKIETGSGDIARATGRHTVAGHNIYFASLNRNKKSVLLDLTTPEGRAGFEALITTSHALITNLRPAAIRKLGLTYDQLRPVNPELVCVALTGFGLTGPFSELPAYDYIIQAMVGVMMLTGDPGTTPVRAGYSVADNTGGMMAAIGLLAKLVERKGGQVDVALYDTLLSQLNYLAAAWLNAGEHPERAAMGAHNFFVPAQIFATADGHIALFITHDAFWRTFAEAAGQPDWLSDARFATMAQRSANRATVVDAIQAELVRRTSEEWIGLLQPLGIVVAAVGTLEDALESDQVGARNMIVSIAANGQTMRFVGNPIKLDGMVDSPAAPPRLDGGRALVESLIRAG